MGEAPEPRPAGEQRAEEAADAQAETLENQRNLERARLKLRQAYERFKEALGPAADYVSAKTREAYERSKKALSEALEAIQEDQAEPER